MFSTRCAVVQLIGDDWVTQVSESSRQGVRFTSPHMQGDIMNRLDILNEKGRFHLCSCTTGGTLNFKKCCCALPCIFDHSDHRAINYAQVVKRTC